MASVYLAGMADALASPARARELTGSTASDRLAAASYRFLASCKTPDDYVFTFGPSRTLEQRIESEDARLIAARLEEC